MERIRIHGESKSPSVLLDADKGTLEITGRSVPENAEDFYKLIIFGIEEYLKNSDKKLKVFIDLEYFNTSSARQLMLLFKTLKGSNSKVTWYYEEGDDDMQEAGEDYKQMLEGLDFEAVERKKE